MAVSSKYTQDLSVQIVFFTFSSKWFLCFYVWAVIWSYIVDLFAALHELASASARTLLKLASSVRALLKPYGDTLMSKTIAVHVRFKFLYISLLSSAKQQRGMTKFCPVYGTWTTTASFSHFHLELYAVVTYLA